MPDYTDYEVVKDLLTKAQDANDNLRDRVREQHDFVDDRDGQWAEDVANTFTTHGRPRFTFDKANPIVNQISGEMKKADFGIKVLPSGPGSDKDLAETLNGMVRNIQNISNAKHIYSAAGKSMVTGGFDGWRVVQKFVDGDSMDQDLMIEDIPNAVDSLWLGTESMKQDGSDSLTGWQLVALTEDQYKDKYPDGNGTSVQTDRKNRRFEQKPDQVIVADFYYKQPITKELVMLTDGRVVEDNEDFQKIKDELAAANPPVTIALDEEGEERRRSRKVFKVMHRQFDGDDWLTEARETVFTFIPLIPTYGNFKVRDGKIIYRGVIDKLMDPCRVYNYARSRQIEEGALSPRDKIWMTPEQIKGFQTSIQTMNTNIDPVQQYNVDNTAPPPFKLGPSQINQGLAETAQSANDDVAQAAGLFAANLGDNPGLQSGVAIDSLKETGDTGTIDYYESQEIAICHTARILVDAIPRVYDATRQVRILGEDDTANMVFLNQKVIDNETGDVVTLNDLSVGKYDVTCTVGKSYKNRQQETVAAITEVATFDPTIMQEGGDILLGNITAPGMDLVAARKRQQLFNANLIPEDQWTDEEREQQQLAQQQQEQQPPTPEEMIGQAELTKAQTDQQTAQFEQQVKIEELKQAQQKLDQEGQKIANDGRTKEIDLLFKQQKQQSDLLTDAVNQMKTLTEAFGIEGLGGRAPATIIAQQGELVNEQQDKN